jgi:uncharacterized protein YndB with AHSA1/START domain
MAGTLVAGLQAARGASLCLDRHITDSALRKTTITTTGGSDVPEPTDVQMQDLGELECHGDTALLRFTRRLARPPEKVWRALVEPEHLAAWFPTTIDGERAAGARLRFRHRDDMFEPFDGEMLAFEPPSLLELRWGPDILRFELEADGGGTLLVFTDTLEELGKAARDGAGWHECLERLAYELAGETPPSGSADRWRQVHPEYVERLGAQAAAIGPPEDWERANREAGGDGG